jgi:hypothetical protein
MRHLDELFFGFGVRRYFAKRSFAASSSGIHEQRGEMVISRSPP